MSPTYLEYYAIYTCVCVPVCVMCVCFMCIGVMFVSCVFVPCVLVSCVLRRTELNEKLNMKFILHYCYYVSEAYERRFCNDVYRRKVQCLSNGYPNDSRGLSVVNSL